MSKRVLIPIADGSEDLEVVTLIDVLRRAEFDVVVASAEELRMLTCARGTRITADTMLLDVLAQDFDLIVLPGGMPGAKTLGELEPLAERVRQQARVDHGPDAERGGRRGHPGGVRAEPAARGLGHGGQAADDAGAQERGHDREDHDHEHGHPAARRGQPRPRAGDARRGVGAEGAAGRAEVGGGAHGCSRGVIVGGVPRAGRVSGSA